MILEESPLARLAGAAALIIGVVAGDGRSHGSRAWTAVPEADGRCAW